MRKQFTQISQQIGSLGELLRNYIDGYVITSTVAKKFSKSHKSNHENHDHDFSLKEVLKFLKTHSSKRDIQKNENRLFVLAGLINSFLIERHFALKEERETRSVYSGTMEEATKNVIGLSNFVSSFGVILHERTIAGKKDSEIKRVMDTEPNEMKDSDTDFELYKLPLSKSEQDHKADEIKRENDAVAKANSQEDQLSDDKPSTLEKELEHDPVIQQEKKIAQKKEIEDLNKIHHRVRLVGGDSSLNSEGEGSEEVEEIVSTSELERRREKKIERDEEHFAHETKEIQDQDSEVLVHESDHRSEDLEHRTSKIQNHLEASVVNDLDHQSSMKNTQNQGNSSSEQIDLATVDNSSPVVNRNQDFDHAQSGIIEQELDMSQNNSSHINQLDNLQSETNLSPKADETEIQLDHSLSNRQNEHNPSAYQSQAQLSQNQLHENEKLSHAHSERQSELASTKNNSIKQNSQLPIEESQSQSQLMQVSDLENDHQSIQISDMDEDLRNASSEKNSFNNEELNSLKYSMSQRSKSMALVDNQDLSEINTRNESLSRHSEPQELKSSSQNYKNSRKAKNQSVKNMGDISTQFEKQEKRFKELEKHNYPKVDRVDDDMLRNKAPHSNFTMEHVPLSLTGSLKKFESSPDTEPTYKTLNQMTSVPFQEMKEGILNNKEYQSTKNKSVNNQALERNPQIPESHDNFANSVSLETEDHPGDRRLLLKNYIKEKKNRRNRGSIYNTRKSFLPTAPNVDYMRHVIQPVNSPMSLAASREFRRKKSKIRSQERTFQPIQYAKKGYMPKTILDFGNQMIESQNQNMFGKNRQYNSSVQNRKISNSRKLGIQRINENQEFSVYGKKKWANLGKIPLV